MKKYIFKDGDAEETLPSTENAPVEGPKEDSRMPFLDEDDNEQAFM